MSKATQRWSDELKQSIDLVKTMRDEVKVQLHLASKEIQQRFEKLEARFENEQLMAKNNIDGLLAGFREVKEQLRKHDEIDERR